MKMYLVATDEVAYQMEERSCVKPSDFEFGALQLFFASGHAPPQAATEGGLNFLILEFELPAAHVVELFSEQIV